MTWHVGQPYWIISSGALAWEEAAFCLGALEREHPVPRTAIRIIEAKENFISDLHSRRQELSGARCEGVGDRIRGAILRTVPHQSL